MLMIASQMFAQSACSGDRVLVRTLLGLPYFLDTVEPIVYESREQLLVGNRQFVSCSIEQCECGTRIMLHQIPRLVIAHACVLPASDDQSWSVEWDFSVDLIERVPHGISADRG
jgi:hypothetical protein